MTSGKRLILVDAARGAALIAMMIYHFTWDLALFGYIDGNVPVTGGWKLFARAIAFSFLFLVGVSLVLASERGFDRRATLNRLARIGGAAAVITIGTLFALPESPILFGILHSIFVASVLGLMLVRCSPWIALAVAATVYVCWWTLAGAIDVPWLFFLGLNATILPSVDFVPVLPWFAATALGIGITRFWRASVKGRAFDVPNSFALRALSILGRHSLVVYLVHQPILIALIWVVTSITR